MLTRTFHGNSHWSNRYYTASKEQTKEHGSIPVRCAWMDGNGDQPTTGIQIYWPRFDGVKYPAKASNPGRDFCNDHATLLFHTDHDPNKILLHSTKRDEVSANAGLQALPRAAATSLKTGSSDQWAHKLVRSSLLDQTASYLCNAKGSAGPSFVSYEERMFCYMPTKQLFPFCEDVKFGACWSHELNSVTPKLVDTLVPAINFTHIADWTKYVSIAG